VLIPAPDSPVNCGFISRFPVIDALAHLVHVEGSRYSRYILEVTVDCGDAPLIIFNNHWKSKSGGAEETEASRIACAAFLKGRIQELNEAEPGLEFVVLGDLNENIDEYVRNAGRYQTALIPTRIPVPGSFSARSIFTTLDKAGATLSSAEIILFSPWDLTDQEGSYFYNGAWETIDHFLLPPSLFDGENWDFSSFDVMDEDFLLTDGEVPKRWITDFETGYSDHLPLKLTLTLHH
jgi:endonuclease/exonuclease/phosphatase family metal-dependent hydrolase